MVNACKYEQKNCNTSIHWFQSGSKPGFVGEKIKARVRDYTYSENAMHYISDHRIELSNRGIKHPSSRNPSPCAPSAMHI